MQWNVAGEWSGKAIDRDGKPTESRSGSVAGVAKLPVRSGYFNVGNYSDGGLNLSFNMGEKRVNWNRFAMTRHGFKEPQDWSGVDGFASQNRNQSTT